MRVLRTTLVRRIAVDPAGADYASAFAAPTHGLSPLTPEEWARATFEGAPIALRWFMLAGWRGMLGLRLGPRSSADHILGWPVTESGLEKVVMETHSPLLIARNVVTLGSSEIVWATFVRFENRIGRAIWAVAAPVHHRTITLLLGRAIRRAS